MKMFFAKIREEGKSFISYLTRAKWALLGFGLVVLLTQINTIQLNELAARDAVISDKQSEIDTLENQIAEVYLPQEQQYRDSLTRIAEYISKTDSFLNVGGRGQVVPEYFDTLTYEKIINGLHEDFGGLVNDLEYFFDERAEYFDDIPNVWPIHYSRLMTISSPYGPRFSPFTGKITPHEGIDITSTWGAEILATAPGKIVEHWIYHDIYGKYIVIQHGDRYRTHYAHLSESYIREGMEVDRGFVLGRMGNTGASKGMHLHYGVQEWNKETQEWEWKDPIGFLRRAVGDDIAPEGSMIRDVVLPATEEADE